MRRALAISPGRTSDSGPDIMFITCKTPPSACLEHEARSRIPLLCCASVEFTDQQIPDLQPKPRTTENMYIQMGC